MRVTPEGNVTDGMTATSKLPLSESWQVPHSRPLSGSVMILPTPYWTANRKPSWPPWQGEQVASTISSVSQWRAGSPAPSKWPKSPRTAFDMSTLTINDVLTSAIESDSSSMMYLALWAKAPGSLLASWKL